MTKGDRLVTEDRTKGKKERKKEKKRITGRRGISDEPSVQRLGRERCCKNFR